jgi:hypothetical protein
MNRDTFLKAAFWRGSARRQPDRGDTFDMTGIELSQPARDDQHCADMRSGRLRWSANTGIGVEPAWPNQVAMEAAGGPFSLVGPIQKVPPTAIPVPDLYGRFG